MGIFEDDFPFPKVGEKLVPWRVLMASNKGAFLLTKGRFFRCKPGGCFRFELFVRWELQDLAKVIFAKFPVDQSSKQPPWVFKKNPM